MGFYGDSGGGGSQTDLYVQTILQNTSEASVDWAIRMADTAEVLGDVLDSLDGLGDALLRSKTTLNEIVSSAEAMEAVVSSPMALSACITSLTAFRAALASDTAVGVYMESERALNMILGYPGRFSELAGSEDAFAIAVGSDTAMNLFVNSVSATKTIVASDAASGQIAESLSAMTIASASSPFMNAMAAAPGRYKFFLSDYKIGAALKTIGGLTQVQFDTVNTLAELFSAASPVNLLAANAACLRALLLEPRLLHHIAKMDASYTNYLLNNNSTNTAVFGEALAVCADNPDLFTRKPVAAKSNSTATWSYHIIETNRWEAATVNQFALYFWKMARMTTSGQYARVNTNRNGVAVEIGAINTNDGVFNRFGFGCPGIQYANIYAWQAASNTEGEAFIPV